MAPEVNSGRLALVSNTFQVLMGEHRLVPEHGTGPPAAWSLPSRLWLERQLDVSSCVLWQRCGCALTRRALTLAPSIGSPAPLPSSPPLWHHPAIHIALLNFTSVGWRVPFRLHLLLQTVNVWMLVRFGLHPYCRSKVGHAHFC